MEKQFGVALKLAQLHRKTADLATLFRYSPKQTHLNKLSKVFRITRKLQAGLELNSAGQWISNQFCPVFKKVEIDHVAIVYKTIAI